MIPTLKKLAKVFVGVIYKYYVYAKNLIETI